MKFYGSPKSLCSWKKIIETELGNTCGEIKDEPERSSNSASFTTELSKADRDFLQDNFWYEIEAGQDSPWNWRVAYLE